jgi:hypothetical protein
MEHITLEEYKKQTQKGNSKYKAKKTIVDGIKFDSQKEANRYLELKLLEKQGLIKYIDRQTRFELQPSYKKNGKTIRAIYYVADFVYFDKAKKKIIIEDTKGYRTEIYKLKKKIFEYKYPDLEIKEV